MFSIFILPQHKRVVETILIFAKSNKKTFVRWCNQHLSKKNSQISDVIKDFSDGTQLILLLESLTGMKLPKPIANPKMRVHKIQNLNIALKFMSGKHKRMQCFQ